MSGETYVTIMGYATSDPELRWTQGGLAVVNLTVAATSKKFDKKAGEMVDDTTVFMRMSAWRDFAENIANSITKGTRVIAYGQLRQREWEDKNGEKRSTIELQVEELGPSLKYARAQVDRNPRSGGRPANPASDPWATPQGVPPGLSDDSSKNGFYDEQTPF